MARPNFFAVGSLNHIIGFILIVINVVVVTMFMKNVLFDNIGWNFFPRKLSVSIPTHAHLNLHILYIRNKN